MIIVNIYEVKAKRSEYLEHVARGERVLICKRNRPVAELRAIASARETPRPLGGAKAVFTVPALRRARSRAVHASCPSW